MTLRQAIPSRHPAGCAASNGRRRITTISGLSTFRKTRTCRSKFEMVKQEFGKSFPLTFPRTIGAIRAGSDTASGCVGADAGVDARDQNAETQEKRGRPQGRPFAFVRCSRTDAYIMSMPPMPPGGMPGMAGVVLLRRLGHARLGGDEQACNGGRILQRSPYNLGGVDDALVDQIDIVVVLRVVAEGRRLSARCTLPTTIEPSTPAFSAIWRIGACSARRTMLTPAS